AFDEIEAELWALKIKVGDAQQFLKAHSSKGSLPEAAGITIGGILATALAPAYGKIQGAHDRNAQIQRNLHVAFALAAYRADHEKYPAKIDALTPAYLAVVPDDLFDGRPLRYHSAGPSYLLYSVGENGKDEGGQGPPDSVRGDDLTVRMPLSDLKTTKFGTGRDRSGFHYPESVM